jgi:hypothetical protein
MVPSNEYDFGNSPEFNNAPSPLSLGPIAPSIYQVSPVFQDSNLQPLNVPSPVSLLYTGSQDSPPSPGGPPLVLNVTTPSDPGNDLFTPDPPQTPDVTTDFDNSPIQFGPNIAEVPEPRLASFLAIAAALALGILVARRRSKKEAFSPTPTDR